MRLVIILMATLALSGCSRAVDRHLDRAYNSYNDGNCDKALLELSRAERNSRSRQYLQPEISLLRGQCLERMNLLVDAAQTYEYILKRYPASEYAHRATARLETLNRLGHYSTATVVPVPAK